MEKQNYEYYNRLMRFIERSQKMNLPQHIKYALDMISVADKAAELYLKTYLDVEVPTDIKMMINNILQGNIFNYEIFSKQILFMDEVPEYHINNKDVKNMYMCIMLLDNTCTGRLPDGAYYYLLDLIYDYLERFLICATTIKNPIKKCAIKIVDEMNKKG